MFQSIDCTVRFLIDQLFRIFHLFLGGISDLVSDIPGIACTFFDFDSDGAFTGLCGAYLCTVYLFLYLELLYAQLLFFRISLLRSSYYPSGLQKDNLYHKEL